MTRTAAEKDPAGRSPRRGGTTNPMGRVTRRKTPRRRRAGAAVNPGRTRANVTRATQADGKGQRASGPRASRAPRPASLRQWLPALRHPGGLGLGVIVAVVEGTGNGWDQVVATAHRLTVLPRSRRTRQAKGSLKPEQTNSRAARALLRAGRTEELARVLGALGSTHRLRILFKLLEGAATYRTLQKVTGLKAGPLYHHISQLRLAELVGPKQRDLYDLTRAGRNVVVVASVLGSLSRDRRPRPAPIV